MLTLFERKFTEVTGLKRLVHTHTYKHTFLELSSYTPEHNMCVNGSAADLCDYF